MIFLLFVFNFIAWFSHPSLWKIGCLWPLFFNEWRIFWDAKKSREVDKILPTHTTHLTHEHPFPLLTYYLADQLTSHTNTCAAECGVTKRHTQLSSRVSRAAHNKLGHNVDILNFFLLKSDSYRRVHEKNWRNLPKKVKVWIQTLPFWEVFSEWILWRWLFLTG